MKTQSEREPELFHMEHDARPAAERSTADRYREPSLLDAIREAPAKPVQPIVAVVSPEVAEMFGMQSLVDVGLARIEPAPPRVFDYDRLIGKAQAMAPAGIRVDMCRHVGVPETYWLFDGEQQVGSVASDPQHDRFGCAFFNWRASRMYRGMPIGELRSLRLDDAIKWAAN